MQNLWFYIYILHSIVILEQFYDKGCDLCEIWDLFFTKIHLNTLKFNILQPI